jgi:hypothetical protein
LVVAIVDPHPAVPSASRSSAATPTTRLGHCAAPDLHRFRVEGLPHILEPGGGKGAIEPRLGRVRIFYPGSLFLIVPEPWRGFEGIA